MLPEDLKNRIIISGQEFDNADFIFTNYYSEVDPKINDKYSIPENFKKYSSVKKGNILIYEFYKNSDTLKKVKIFIYKSLIVFFLALVLFKITVGSLVNNYEKNKFNTK